MFHFYEVFCVFFCKVCCFLFACNGFCVLFFFARGFVIFCKGGFVFAKGFCFCFFARGCVFFLSGAWFLLVTFFVSFC